MTVLVITDTDREALTTGAGLVDRSERGKLALTGADRRSFLNGQVTNEIEALEPGGGTYAAFLTHKGKMLGDVRVLETGEELLLDTERVALQALFDLVRRFSIGYDVQLHKRTLQTGLLSLVGPRAAAVADAEDLPAEEHAHRAGTLGGRPARLVRTRAGVDVLTATEDVEAVRAALLQAGAVAVAEASAEVLRVEAGVPRYGVDLDDTVIPQEAALNERAVSFTKGCYVGQETVARLFYKGKPNRHLRGLRLSGPAAPGDPLVLTGESGEREVGRLGSVADSPQHGPIALALVRREAAPGDVVRVGDGDTTAVVTELPFAPAD
ncbi:YgfZ/GcvT domain-containing protein [Paraconexibacter algicola]|uniref:Folate-binding protein n=1 Tax=Paraconexibacter algicola TaxID=2133960 RepID=A0A2T4UDR4_9ACTN|nr:folate-binding protein YgfZ [Paraconexibacter algicola]PTL55615.1 folate-binding protein [Paraconexibacter algicola]